MGEMHPESIIHSSLNAVDTGLPVDKTTRRRIVQLSVPSRSESTSRHRLSADRRLSKVQRVLWIVYNLANNAWPRVGIDNRIEELKFRLSEAELERFWGNIAEAASPSRALCDLFWMSLPWDVLARELGGVRVLEVGCGTGAYGTLLKRLLGTAFERYMGVDVEPDENWKQHSSSSPQFVFEIGRASEACKFLPGSNLILTQSALEHFEEDLLYFSEVASHVLASTFPILQVHLIPSASCITTFPWHGVREYTPRTLSKITRLFGAETKTYLFELGGSRCNQIHRKFITWPNLTRGVDLRRAEKSRYRQALRSAIESDFALPAGNPAFYALILASNFRGEPVWKA